MSNTTESDEDQDLRARLASLVRSWESGNAEFGATDRERNRTAVLRAIIDEQVPA